MERGETMKAIVVAEKGGPEKLVLQEVVDPTPGPTELLVQVKAAGLNFYDIYQRNGLYPIEFPIVPGLEGGGTVVEVGSDAAGFKVGDAVGWTDVLGSYAEKHVIPADGAIPLGDTDPDTAAALLLQGITAHYLAIDTYPLSDKDTCLIHAGAGGVGLLLTQIAKMRGARVISTVGTDEKAVLSREAGADDVVVYTRDNFKEAVEELLGPNRVDVVYDGVGAATFEPSLDLLRPRGMMVTFGNASGPAPDVAPLQLAQKGSIFLTRPTMAHYMRTREELLGRTDDLFKWVANGQLEVRVGVEYPLAEAADAHRALESRETMGKVLIRP